MSLENEAGPTTDSGITSERDVVSMNIAIDGPLGGPLRSRWFRRSAVRRRTALLRKKGSLLRSASSMSDINGKTRLKTIYVAVVVRNSNYEFTYDSMLTSHRADDGWFALMDTDKDRLITEALKKRTEFGSDKYEVWVGTLSEKVLVPTNFKVVKF